MELKRRSIAKSTTWRALASSITFLLAYGSMRLELSSALITAGIVGIFDIPVKLLAYVVHERSWLHILWGRTPGKVVWLYGLPASGKTELAKTVQRLHKGNNLVRLDGDVLRKQNGLCSDLKFSPEDRHENLRRTAAAAKLLADAGNLVLAANITPREENRGMVKELLEDQVMFVFVDASPILCENRDHPETGTRKSGMWQAAKRGEIKEYTGVSDVFELPSGVLPDLHIDMSKWDGQKQACARMVIDLLAKRGAV